ncbi:hypothetical protein BEL07_17470 [Mycolicibacterium grossiae]|uniref:Uncharacterized protein n=1 Tax=Mycolicibacterium grossiae TaxID=1552759 RepID=A0A1E8Q300_9MYCO|nr:hypothetical protein BEL07_17470 [Mycolicibacterium grossiae]
MACGVTEIARAGYVSPAQGGDLGELVWSPSEGHRVAQRRPETVFTAQLGVVKRIGERCSGGNRYRAAWHRQSRTLRPWLRVSLWGCPEFGVIV